MQFGKPLSFRHKNQRMAYIVTEPENILVIRLAGLGDMILTLSAVSPIKKRFPDTTIYFLTNRSMLSFLKCFDFIQETILYPQGIGSVVKTVAKIRGLHIDTIVNFERALKKSIITFISGAKKRIGFDSLELAPFLTDRVRDIKDDKKTHRRERYLNLTRLLGIKNYDILMPFLPTLEAKARVKAFLSQHNIRDADFLVGINPVASFISKYWDNDKWACVADYLIQKRNAKVIMTFGPSPGQLETARDILDRMKEKAILSFETNLIEFGALMQKFRLLICLDSGPFHFAVSQGIPTISLFRGRGNLDQWGPPFGPHIAIFKNLPCSPCELFQCKSRACMKQILAQDVIKEIDIWCQRYMPDH